MVQIQLRNVRNWKHECKFFSKKIVLIGFLLFKFQKYSKEFHPLKFPLEGRKGGEGGGAVYSTPKTQAPYPKFPISTTAFHTLFEHLDVFLHTLREKCPYSVFFPYCPAFGLNTERYSACLWIQSECGKIWTRKTPNTDTFHAVTVL